MDTSSNEKNNAPNEKNNAAKMYLKEVCYFCGKNNPTKLNLPSDPAEIAKIELLTGCKFIAIKDGPQSMCSSCAAYFDEFNQFYKTLLSVEVITRDILGLNPPTNNGGESSEQVSMENVTLEVNTEDGLVEKDTSEDIIDITEEESEAVRPAEQQ